MQSNDQSDGKSVNRQGRETIESILQHIEETDWEVVDYNPTIDQYEPLSVTVTIEHRPPLGEGRDTRQAVKAIISDAETDASPVHYSTILSRAGDELGLTWNECERVTDELKERGEIYMPEANHYRVT